MKGADTVILERLLSELDLPSYGLGTELSKAFIDPGGGVNFIRLIFSIPGMANRIMSLAPEIKECNIIYQTDPVCSCVVELKQKRDEIMQEVRSHGIASLWDVFDNFWDKLPGD